MIWIERHQLGIPICFGGNKTVAREILVNYCATASAEFWFGGSSPTKAARANAVELGDDSFQDDSFPTPHPQAP